MNAGDLLQHYERIADSPGAIERLRRFVLDLAVRGKIVGEVHADEPASELLHRIRTEKARLSAAGLTKLPKAIPQSLIAPFEIPSRWRWTQLAEIGLVSPKNEAPDSIPASFVPMTLVAAQYGMPHGHEVRPWVEIKKGYTHFANGDVGLAKITPCFENGKSTVFRGLINGIGSGTTELHVVRPLLTSPDFVVLFLKSPHFVETGIPKMTGTAGQKRVPVEYFAHSPFPLPPLPEQHRIVAKVNELMALCDRLEAARVEREAARDRLAAATLARLNSPDPETFAADARFALDAMPTLTARSDQLKQVRQTILSLAVQGKLLPQNPDDQSADDWYQATTGKSPDAFDELSPSSNLPSGWISLPMEAVFEVAGGIQKTPDRNPRGNAFPYLGVANVYRGRLDLSIVKEFELAPGELERRKLLSGDLLIIEGNGTLTEIGRCAKWSGEIANCVHQNHVIRCRPRDPSIADFTLLVLNSPIGMASMQRLAITSSGLYSLSVGKIRQIEIPLPPIAEQRRIVSKVRELFGLCEQLEASLRASDVQRSKLLEALLNDALGPQTVTDEPAISAEPTFA